MTTDVTPFGASCACDWFKFELPSLLMAVTGVRSITTNSTLDSTLHRGGQPPGHLRGGPPTRGIPFVKNGVVAGVTFGWGPRKKASPTVFAVFPGVGGEARDGGTSAFRGVVLFRLVPRDDAPYTVTSPGPKFLVF